MSGCCKHGPRLVHSRASDKPDWRPNTTTRLGQDLVRSCPHDTTLINKPTMGRKKKGNAGKNDKEEELDWEMEGPDPDVKRSTRGAGNKATGRWRKMGNFLGNNR